MKQRRIGRTGLKVSEICLGTMTFAGQSDEATSFRILDRAFERGVTFIDTADAYPIPPEPETAGPHRGGDRALACRGARAAAPDRAGDEVPHPGRPWSERPGALASPYPGRVRCQSSAAADRLRSISTRPTCPTRRRRSTRHCAPSTIWFARARFATSVVRIIRPGSLPLALSMSERQGWARYDCVQPRYNVLYREIENELLPLCRDQGVGVIVYNPLAGGLLTGKHRSESGPEPGTSLYARAQRASSTATATGTLPSSRRSRRLKSYCEQRGWSLATASVAWVLRTAGNHVGDRRGQPARAARGHARWRRVSSSTTRRERYSTRSGGRFRGGRSRDSIAGRLH